MKNKASLVLLEQLVMILVFSLAAAACLRMFAWSDRTSREMEQRSEAVVLCQNAAETVKAAGDLEEGALLLGASRQGSIWTADCGGTFQLELKEVPSPVPGLGEAEIRVVLAETQELLFSITTGWQEAAS